MGDKKIRVGITLGDVNGIGPEVTIKAFADPRMCELCTPIIYGSGKVLAFYKKGIREAESFQFSEISCAREARQERINLIDCMGEVSAEPGAPSAQAGAAAVRALRKAAADLKAGEIDVVVTAPFNKETVQDEEFNYRGHTDFFAAEFAGTPLMIMCSEILKVGLATIHMPVSEISSALSTEGIVNSLARLKHSLVADFGIVNPKIAVLALNPHAGDGGLLGTEEQQIITPAVNTAYQKGILAFGPFAADGFFAAAGYARYDAVLAMYHDQGLAPFKTLSPDGVNYTAGLSVVRTSPDHGTAFDIAGQDKADPASMRQAVYTAMDIWRNRRVFEQMTANPLKHYERERNHKDLSVRDLIPENEDRD